MRNIASFALTWAAVFMTIVAVMLDSWAMFYMGTALVATIAACRFQAWLSVRGLRFERVAPETVHVGDLVTVEITAWSERRVRRPLITVQDKLPKNIVIGWRGPSLPIAPAYDRPIRTQYQFRPMKRGRYRWSDLEVAGTDALGIAVHSAEYRTTEAEMTVLPRAIPVSLELPSAAGWGIDEAETGQTRGAGIEPRGVREFAAGDSLRHVHWRSSARAGRLLVKEFEAGTHAAASIMIQREKGTEIGQGADTSLELMCGHAAFLAENFLRQGARVEFTGLEEHASHGSPNERKHEIYETLAKLEADQNASIGAELLGRLVEIGTGSAVFLMLTVADPVLPAAIAQLRAKSCLVVPLVYDAAKFKGGNRVASAADPEYLQSLRQSGAQPILMPHQGGESL